MHADSVCSSTSAPPLAQVPGFAMNLDFPSLPSSSRVLRQQTTTTPQVVPVHTSATTLPVGQSPSPLLLPPAPPAPVPRAFMEHAPPLWQFSRAKADLDSTGPLLVHVHVVRRTKKGMPLAGSRVLRMRYGFHGGKPLSLFQIAGLLKVTHEAVRKTEKNAFEKVRRSATEIGLRHYISRISN
ncbi:hypothetical protein L7F22_051498 [Adiantum nelumboides]|nr:hypothetical protein [Adiantum nelumboides]